MKIHLHKVMFYGYESSQILPKNKLTEQNSIHKTRVNVYNAYLATPPYFREKKLECFCWIHMEIAHS